MAHKIKKRRYSLMVKHGTPNSNLGVQVPLPLQNIDGKF